MIDIVCRPKRTTTIFAITIRQQCCRTTTTHNAQTTMRLATTINSFARSRDVTCAAPRCAGVRVAPAPCCIHVGGIRTHSDQPHYRGDVTMRLERTNGIVVVSRSSVVVKCCAAVRRCDEGECACGRTSTIKPAGCDVLQSAAGQLSHIVTLFACIAY